MGLTIPGAARPEDVPRGPELEGFSDDEEAMFGSAVVNLGQGSGFEESTEDTRRKAREMSGG